MTLSSCFVLKDSHPVIQEQLLTGQIESAIEEDANKNKKTKEKNILEMFCCFEGNNGNKDGGDNDDDDDGIGPSKDRGVLVDQTTPALQGRAYCTERAKKQGGITLQDMTYGAMYAFLSIIDDTPNKLDEVSKSGGPWHVEAMRIMVMYAAQQKSITEHIDYEIEIRKPLSYILQTYFDLTMDQFFDVKGWKGGHVIDTQGYIAHNDSTIVLAYQCTANVNDWLANFTSTTSVWETEDIERGHTGVLSGLSGFFRPKHNATNPRRGRVHTGFYNYFLASIPAIHQFIDPLLLDTSTPKTLYIVGHSLGGGIAHMALLYFLLEYQDRYDWKNSPHRLVLVTAGSPRAYTNTVQQIVDDEIQKYDAGKVQAIRLVCDDDAVTVLPPPSLGFAHLRKQKWIFISTDGAILINPNRRHRISKSNLRELLKKHPSISSKTRTVVLESTDDDDNATELQIDDELHKFMDVSDEEYKKKLAAIPKSFRDHMPEFYLKPLLYHLQKESTNGSIQPAGVNQRAAT
jgi:pimeloyl-ACP methyl ester carboxylesterase